MRSTERMRIGSACRIGANPRPSSTVAAVSPISFGARYRTIVSTADPRRPTTRAWDRPPGAHPARRVCRGRRTTARAPPPRRRSRARGPQRRPHATPPGPRGARARSSRRAWGPGGRTGPRRPDPAACVDQDADRRPPAVPGSPNGELRIVCERGSGADHDRVRPRAEPVNVGAGGLTRDPAGRAVASRDLAVERGRRLPDDERHPRSHVFGEGLVQPLGDLGQDPVAHLDPAVAEHPRPRPSTTRFGSVVADTTRATPARTIASVHGGVRP